MPRIVPLQLLRCLKVLLDDNGGILSAGEVKRIAGLMTKYSKKLVSKCIYVLILKCTKTELLGEFMGVGGWNLVYTWLNDGIRAMNWPLVEEILELLLLSPVDVHRLKINSAPKLVKGLCKDGGNEGVRILAKRLVEQWLKVVTENTAAAATTTIMPPQANQIPVIAPIAADQHQQTNVGVNQTANTDPLAPTSEEQKNDETDSDALTPAQKKARETGLVYKMIIKDGQQVLAKIPKSVEKDKGKNEHKAITVEEKEIESGEEEEYADYEKDSLAKPKKTISAAILATGEADDSSSLDKPQKDNDSSCDGEEEEQGKEAKSSNKKFGNNEQHKSNVDEKLRTEKKERKSSKDSKDSKDGKSYKSEKDKDRKSSSSSNYKSSSSSSNHKSSSSSKSNSSSSKSKSSSSSSSSHRSSSDKHRNDKERSSSSSSKDKERKENTSSTSSKHKSSSSSSKTTLSSSSSKDRVRDKDYSTASSTKKDKEREKELQAQKDKETLAKMMPPSIDKLGKIQKKPKDDAAADTFKTTSITIPSKKSSMSIEIRRDSEKAKTVKMFNSQFRSHGLDEEAPPPPSRKSLKKPNSSITAPGTALPSSLPSSLKRSSPTSHDSLSEKKAKLELNSSRLMASNEKPGSIKLIPPKKIQTLIETNIFSDALSAATEPKKIIKRKRQTSTSSPGGHTKEGPSPPVSPLVSPKVAPLKFYQDTLNESITEEKSDKGNELNESKELNKSNDLDASIDRDNLTEDDDDIPLKKVKEDIELQVLKEQKTTTTKADSIEINSDQDDEYQTADDDSVRKPPGPGCGPDGPPGVLMLHRRKGPKKKLTWRPEAQLQQIRYFEVDETERVNVTKSNSFMDMKNMERFSERDAINMSRRGFNHEDNMEPQTDWHIPLIVVDDVPPHPEGSQSKQRKVQADREMTTLRALYFSPSMIPDSPAEAELEPHFSHDIPVIPLDDITGNPDAVNDFTSMPWPDPKGINKNDAVVGLVETIGGGVGVDGQLCIGGISNNPFNPFMSPYGAAHQNGPMPTQMQRPNGRLPPPGWQAPPLPNGMIGQDNIGMMRNPFNSNSALGSPSMDMGPPQNFMNPNNQFGPGAPFMQGPQQFVPNVFNGPFGPMGPGNGLMCNGPITPLMNGMPTQAMMNGQRNNNMNMNMNNNNNNNNNNINNNKNQNRNHNNNNNNSNWRSGGGNYNDNSGGDSRNGNWRSAGSGHNRGGSGGGGNGICKAFIRGHCRVGKSCKFIHPNKNKNRI